MTTQANNVHHQPAARARRTVALVGRYAHRHIHEIAGRVADCQVVVVESTAHAYSKIKRTLPDVVVMCLSDEDVNGCHVLSMLALDSETSHIPVLTYVASDIDDVDDADAGAVENSFFGSSAMSLN